MMSSHILVIFCATAGKNGEELGVDEEQIVLFVYLLFDITNCKVVAVQQHYVKPQPNELSETVLTEDCKQETGLQEEAIKNSQPLEHVLDEFDRFLSSKGVHPEHGGKTFCILTDGQAHLRQCLHPEASNKNITLPTYFHKFYDLRKEFKKFYKTDNITNIKAMLDYLGIQEVHSVEYGVRQCQEMASVLHRLVNDGHSFSDPEIINERLEPGICSKTDVVDDETVVRARGLPWQSSDQDIARFFKGLNISKGGVALCLSPQGRRNGEALVRFDTEEHRDLALKRHKHHIGQRYIEVYKATGKDFVNVAGGSNTEAQAFLSRGGEVIIRMRGLPFTATAQQVLEFFAREPSVNVLDGEEGILFVHYPGTITSDEGRKETSMDKPKKSGLLSSYSPYSSQDPSLNVPVTAGPAGTVMSPYLGIDPAYIQGGADSQFIFPEGSSRHRGRFETAFSVIGSSVFLGGALGGGIGAYNGIKSLNTADTTAIKRTHMLNYVGKGGSGMAQSFGVIAVMYSVFGLGIGYVRGEEPGSADFFTSVTAGTLTGALYRSTGILKSAAARQKCIIGAAIGFGLTSILHLSSGKAQDYISQKWS